MTVAGVASATVETLTAEVRVLMVGSRQITLSVARQLDAVQLEEVEPFGRVALDAGVSGVTPHRGWVIGRQRDTGVLVRAEFNTWRGVPFVGELSPPIVVCDGLLLGDRHHSLRLSIDGRQFEVEGSSMVGCGLEHHRWDLDRRCQGWHADAMTRTAIAEQLAAWDAAAARHASALALPLIVLAGLR
jgi:hypothetical protein